MRYRRLFWYTLLSLVLLVFSIAAIMLLFWLVAAALAQNF